MSEDSGNDMQRLPEQRSDAMLSMIEIAKALTSCLQVHSVLETLMKQVERLISPEAWSLLLVDQTSRDLVFKQRKPAVQPGQAKKLVSACPIHASTV